MTVFVQRTDGKLDYTFDWSNDIPDPLTLVSVTHTALGGCTIVSQTVDTTAKSSTVFVRIDPHGATGQVRGLALASNGAEIPGEATIRAFDS